MFCGEVLPPKVTSVGWDTLKAPLLCTSVNTILQGGLFSEMLLGELCHSLCIFQCGLQVTWNSSLLQQPAPGGPCLLGLRCYWASPGVSFSAACRGEVAVLPKRSGSFAGSSLCTWFPQHGKIHLNATSTKNQCLPEPCLVQQTWLLKVFLGPVLLQNVEQLHSVFCFLISPWNFWC